MEDGFLRKSTCLFSFLLYVRDNALELARKTLFYIFIEIFR